MNNKQLATLRKIFEMPTRADIPWADIESLLDALGAILKGKKGSRVGVSLGGHYALFHGPHPRPDTDKGTVERIREFLQRAGVTP